MCFMGILGGCAIMDSVTGGLIGPSQPNTQFEGGDVWAKQFNDQQAQIKTLMDALIDKESTPAIVAEVAPVIEAKIAEIINSSPVKLEPTSLAEGAKTVSGFIPIPGARAGVEGAIALAGLWQMFRMRQGSQKTKKLLKKTAVAIENKTTNGSIKKEVKRLMSRKEQDELDDLTHDARVAVKVAA